MGNTHKSLQPYESQTNKFFARSAEKHPPLLLLCNALTAAHVTDSPLTLHYTFTFTIKP